jgi:putative oxygen-independent coproporphyrinogen III oxidase
MRLFMAIYLFYKKILNEICMLQLTQAIPLSLYIHLPWCVRKCPYCDFNSHVKPEELPEQEYVAALKADFDQHLPALWGRSLVSIFFGGGTPSLFSASAIEDVLNHIRTRIRCQPDMEVTLEANPGTLDEARFRGFRLAGVNRLSIGVQSLQDEKLKALGRIHDRDYALRAIDTAIKVGFDNFNLDFMHGLPKQTISDALLDLQDGLAFTPPHLSWYQLTIEPNTFFHQQPPQLPSDDLLWAIQEAGQIEIQTAGLAQYEISAYAAPNKQCRHNLNYWQFGDYLGIGAGAHSKLTDMHAQTISRHWQVKNPKDYLNPQKNITGRHEILTPAAIGFEFMLNALRLTQGVAAELFSARTGLELTLYKDALKFLRDKKLLINDESRLQTTELGQRFLNDVLSLFLPQE